MVRHLPPDGADREVSGISSTGPDLQDAIPRFFPDGEHPGFR